MDPHLQLTSYYGYFLSFQISQQSLSQILRPSLSQSRSKDNSHKKIRKGGKRARRKDNREKKRARRGHTALSLHRRIRRFKHAMCASFLLSSCTSQFKKKKAAIVIFNFISQGELNFQLHINERTNVEKKSVLNGPFIGGAKLKVWNLASRKYQDPLEAAMKSLSLASQLCVSSHNPAPKPQRRTA